MRRKYHEGQNDKKGTNKYYRHKYEIKIFTGFGG